MSNRLTFSLASLILIFGLVFVVTPAMAHTLNDNPSHTHPTVKVEIATATVGGTVAAPTVVYSPYSDKYFQLNFGDDPSTTTGTAETDIALFRLRFTINTVAIANDYTGAEIAGDIELYSAATAAIKGSGDNQYTLSATTADNDHDGTTTVAQSKTFYSTVSLNKGDGTGNAAAPAIKSMVFTLPADEFQGSMRFTVDDEGVPTTTLDTNFEQYNLIGPAPQVFESGLSPVAFEADESLENKTYTSGTAISSLVLPAAKTGTGSGTLVYSLMDDSNNPIGNGLSFNATTRTLSGTPIQGMATTQYTYKVTDTGVTPNTTASLTFDITVEDKTPPSIQTITHTPLDDVAAPGGIVTFTFNFSEPLASSGDGMFTAADVKVTNGTAGILAKVDTSNSYTLPVTITDLAQNVKVEVTAAGVKDGAGNELSSTLTEEEYEAAIGAALVAPSPTDPNVPVGGLIPVGGIDKSAAKHKISSAGKVKFTLGFNEPLQPAPSLSGLDLSDFDVTSHVYDTEKGETTSTPISSSDLDLTKAASAETYTLTVNNLDTSELQQEVQVKLDPRGVQDANRNTLRVPESTDTRAQWTEDGIPSTWTGSMYESWTFKADTISPRLTITPPGTPVGGGGTAPSGASALGGGGGLSGVPTKREGPIEESLVFRFRFDSPIAPPFTTEAIDRSGGDNNVTLRQDSDPMPTGDPLVWTIKVYPKDPANPTTVLVKKGSVQDASGNPLEADVLATYIPKGDTAPPEVSFAAPNVLECGPDLSATPPDNRITITVTDNNQTITVTGQTPPTITIPASGISTGEKIEESEITIKPKGWKIVNFDNSTPPGATFNLVPIGDGTEIGVTEVTIEIAAGAVKDGDGNGSALTTRTITVGPVVTIPAKGYVTVIRPEHVGLTHLGDPLVVGSLNVRPEQLVSQEWDCMPDLTVFFQRGHVPKDKPNRPGIGGGALVVKESPNHIHPPSDKAGKIGPGTVGISEIMWASDAGLPHGGLPTTGLANRDQTQEQWIELHNTNTFDVTVTLFARPANHALTVEPDEIDRVSNYQLNNTWDVPGKSGDSAYGKDFIAMQRKTPVYTDGKGILSAEWTESTFIYLTRRSTLAGLPVDDLAYDFIGTPGRSNKIDTSLPTVETPIPLKPFVFNEVANRSNSHYEWIELRNTSNVEANLRNYNIGIVTGKKDNDGNFVEDSLFNFPNADVKIAAGELLLVLASDPEDDGEHPVAVGYDVRGGNDQVRGIGLDDDESKLEPAKYIVAGKNEMFYTDGLPDNGEFVLILRHTEGIDIAKPETYSKSHDKPDSAKAKLGTHERIVDVAGFHPNLTKPGDPYYTAPYGLWPLKLRKPPFSQNQLKKDMVYHRVKLDVPGVHSYSQDNTDKPSFVTTGYTGIGYKRHAQNTAAHGGTPGYHDIRKNLVSDIAATGTVIISEIMFDRGRGDNLPQWIELYNSSATQAVNLHSEAGWRLNVENLDDGEMPVDQISGTLNFKNSEVQTILPQQTVLVASARARNAGGASLNAGVVFTPTRIFTVYDDARAALGMKRSTDPILSEQAFHIELIDGKGNLSDAAGNLTKSRRRVAAAAAWDWSVVRSAQPKHPFPEGDVRVSVIRRRWEYKDGQLSKMYSVKELMDMGITAAGWLSAHGPQAEGLAHAPDTWYGDGSDIGTPAITGGRPLPVSLSKFRPERLDDGSIVVRWITESELNNAGFNILRSETKDGEYTKLNTQLIEGQGTTSERTTYTYPDTSAKPNVVYYYQIQDVSLDGEVNTLRVNRLKGHVSAVGKATTTWGELKALQ